MNIVRHLQKNNRTRRCVQKRETKRLRRCENHSMIGNAVNCNLAIASTAIVYCLILSLMILLYRLASRTTICIGESFAKQCGELLYLRACLERKITHDTNNLHALISDKVADLQTAYNLKSPFPVEFAQGRYEGRENIAIICQIVSWNDPWKSANNPTSKPRTEMKCSQT